MILTIAGKELRALFGSPLAWFVLAVLQALFAWLFLAQVDNFLQVQPELVRLADPPGVTEVVASSLFGAGAMVLLMAMPLFTMRLVAEEWRAQTMPLLMSAPVSLTEIVLGKFLGLAAFLAAIVALLVIMALSLAVGTKPDLALIAANAAGLLLLACCYGALGLFLSTLTTHPTVAAVGTLGALLGLWILNATSGDPEHALNAWSLVRRFEALNRGMVDSADIAFLLLFALLFLALAVRRLDALRLRA